MSIKRAKGKTKSAPQKSAKTRAKSIKTKQRAMPGKEKEYTKPISFPGSPVKLEKPANIVDARDKIAKSVVESGAAIAAGVIEAAKKGQLASAKYLFEIAGLYPAVKETVEKTQGDPLARTLLQRLGIPTEPPARKEYPASVLLASETRGANKEIVGRDAVGEKGRGEEVVMTRN